MLVRRKRSAAMRCRASPASKAAGCPVGWLDVRRVVLLRDRHAVPPALARSARARMSVVTASPCSPSPACRGRTPEISLVRARPTAPRLARRDGPMPPEGGHRLWASPHSSRGRRSRSGRDCQRAAGPGRAPPGLHPHSAPQPADRVVDGRPAPEGLSHGRAESAPLCRWARKKTALAFHVLGRSHRRRDARRAGSDSSGVVLAEIFGIARSRPGLRDRRPTRARLRRAHGPRLPASQLLHPDAPDARLLAMRARPLPGDVRLGLRPRARRHDALRAPGRARPSRWLLCSRAGWGGPRWRSPAAYGGGRAARSRLRDHASRRGRLRRGLRPGSKIGPGLLKRLVGCDRTCHRRPDCDFLTRGREGMPLKVEAVWLREPRGRRRLG